MQFYIPNSHAVRIQRKRSPVCRSPFHFKPSMKREAIVSAASKMSNLQDFLNLLNKVKMSELGGKGHPFTMSQLNYFINPKRGTASYKTFTIPKKSGGVRTISAPTKMLKSMLTYTNRILQALYKAPDCVTGFVPAKSVVDNAERHIGMNYIFNTDLKDFFPSIPQARVWGALKCQPFNFKEEIASAIAGLCCIEVAYTGHEGEICDDFPETKYKYVLPQGSPCSPTLTNIVCHNLDWKLSGLARRFHLKYSRYADDITFSSNRNVFADDGEFITEFRRIVAEQNFTLNEKKTRLQKRGDCQEVTGLVVSDRVNVPREYVRDLDNLLYIWEKHGEHAAFTKFIKRYYPKQNLHKYNPNMASVIQGKLMYLKMVKGENDPVWRRLQKRFNRLSNRDDSSTGTNIIYLHTYSIVDFEKVLGCSIEFYTSVPALGDDEGSETSIFDPHFTLNGQTHQIRLSRWIHTRLMNILESGNEEDLKKFKKRYKIAYCKESTDNIDLVSLVAESSDEIEELERNMKARLERERFWMMFRGMKTKNPNIVEVWDINSGSFENSEADSTADNLGLLADTMEEAPKGLTSDEMLEKLVESDFDLNTLEQWEKTRKNN